MTIPALAALYPWTKSLHIMAVIAWMAATFYLPRLYVYHCEVAPGTEASERFKIMEHKLYSQILVPAMIATFILGILLLLTPGIVDWSRGWIHVKLAAVFLMAGFHGALGGWRRAFQQDRNRKSQRYFRIANEVPTLLMAVIVIMVVVQPF